MKTHYSLLFLLFWTSSQFGMESESNWKEALLCFCCPCAYCHLHAQHQRKQFEKLSMAVKNQSTNLSTVAKELEKMNEQFEKFARGTYPLLLKDFKNYHLLIMNHILVALFLLQAAIFGAFFVKIKTLF